MGHRVSGSDRAASKYLEELQLLGVTVHVGHAATQIEGADFLARSTAVPDDNPEVAAALTGGIAVHTRAEILTAITQVKPGILVAGTHGKTTTSSMLAVLLDHAGLNPSFVIGSDVGYFGTGARWTSSRHCVVEADESDGTFLVLPAAHAVVTSLDPDHLEFYGSVQRLEEAFVGFVEAVPGTTAVCIDDPDTGVLLGRSGVVTYGTHEQADLQISQIAIEAAATTFDVAWQGKMLGRVRVGLPGHHNALNAAAAITIARELGLDFDDIVEGLAAFTGVARRFEPRGEHGGVHFVDDYAHLPAEVEAAVGTAMQGPWRRVIAAYQPHRFSRTEALGATFATSFRGVDELVLTDIYPAGEAPRAGVSGRIVFDAVTDACPELRVTWKPTLVEVGNYLADTLGPGDLCLTLGAGDLTTVPDQVLTAMRSESSASATWLRTIESELRESSVRYNEPIGPRTTYRVGGAALAFVEIGSHRDLVRFVDAAINAATPLLPVGKGSNMLVADRGFRGVAFTLAGEFDAVTIAGTSVTLGAAVALPAAARRLARNQLAGFEWAVGVPGTVGGAVAMNAGGHGSNMAATVVAATIMDLTTGEVEQRTGLDLGFGYRSSTVVATDLVLDVTMDLVLGDEQEAEAALSEIVRWRRDHQPGGQNAGSVFRNPVDDSAGRLIEAAGCKGLRVGSATVSDKHANFFQADPKGRADDVYGLMQLVIKIVQSKLGIVLQPETRLVGFE